jgi:hypothetical protein
MSFILILTRICPDAAPERRSGRQAQLSNITAAKVRVSRFDNWQALFEKTNKQTEDRCRRHSNVFGSKGHAKNDSGSDGWYFVSGFCFPMESTHWTHNDLRLTNDGNAILREIDVAHPAAKNMIELSRTQDEECGDGTTSVIILGTYPVTNKSPV